jgi:hypothetical protein
MLMKFIKNKNKSIEKRRAGLFKFCFLILTALRVVASMTHDASVFCLINNN